MNLKVITPFLAAALLAFVSHAAKPFEALVLHPGFEVQEPRIQPVFQIQEKNGFIREYYADVDSVICGDGQCEVITVRLVWNVYGEFLRYEFPKGGNLTKMGHEQFTEADHAKLIKILNDPYSTLADVSAADIVSPVDAMMNENSDTDGTSSATLLSDKSAFVAGAVYTCYTLWHWVHGDMQTEIRNITADTIGTEQLLTMLKNSNSSKVAFAVEALAKRNISDPAIQKQIKALALHGTTELASAAISYFQSQGPTTYYKAISELFPLGDSKKQVLYLSSLASIDLPAPDGFYDRLSGQLPNLGSYYEVHLMLNLMTEHNFDSSQVISNTLPLLQSKSFLIGRRAYNFLKEHKLPAAQMAEVEAFRTKYADRL
ncbi:hypothetical protein EGM51_02685 [Verrucomicrobia bacterium S94]|nr:hypothetical protein EGM51_02685 [Verrucomicrobia bacterium S94]